jgi:hypothetical protein
VLVVDDEDAVRETTRRLLERAGLKHEVLRLIGGASAAA